MAKLPRPEIRTELERVRADLHQLLDSATPADLERRSDGTRWTNEQLLFHMVFGYMVVQRLLFLVRLFGWLPPGVSRGYARLLDAGTRPFDWINYRGSCAAARVYNRRRMGAKLDRVIASLRCSLAAATEADLARGMYFPTRWDPCFTEYMTLEEVFRYPAKHYDFHRKQLTLSSLRG
ncbi:DinB family protein [Nocardia lijiangensis]|uniref:DinB family protein n=1 Tax=Nocardia lijiangensis TaxID=299618 RepID=UPI000830D09C|nr:DinB family protein [Nocardia lijiangensis]